MYRAMMLITLVILMLAVAGVSSAREGVFTELLDQTTGASSGAESTQLTTNETATPKMTDVQETTNTGYLDVPSPKVETKKSVQVHGNPLKNSGRDEASETENGKFLKPERDKKPVRSVEPTKAGRPQQSKNAEREDTRKVRVSKGGRKVTVCHKGKMLTIGAPAKVAHLRHGDGLGDCAG